MQLKIVCGIFVFGFVLFIGFRFYYKLFSDKPVEDSEPKFDFFNFVLKRLLGAFLFLSSLFIICTSFNTEANSWSKSETLYFDIVRKEKNLGYICLKKFTIDNVVKFEIESEVNTKILFNFKANSKEVYIYKKDTLLYSSIHRIINNRVKVDQTIQYQNGFYYLSEKNYERIINSNVINYNLVKLYFEEPQSVAKVFCDKHKVHLNLTKISPKSYKINFPDKTYNIFHYQNNKCKSVEAVGSFYHVSLIPHSSI